MLNEAFYWIFNMSIIAAITGTVVLLIRLIPKIPKRITVFLWIVSFIRMAVPVGINSRCSLMSLLSGVISKNVVVYWLRGSSFLSMINSVGAADSYFPVTYKAEALRNVFGAASAVWLVIASAIALTLLILYFTTLHELKDATQLRDNIYFSEKIQSSAVYGILKPRIILPSAYAGKDIHFILMHEKMHIRRADNLWRMVAFMTAAVHWFNPLAWVFLKLFLSDMELSCDERVLLKLNEEESKDYAGSLLEIKSERNLFASAFGGARIRTRIENILSFKRLTWFSSAGLFALVAAVFFTLLTNAG